MLSLHLCPLESDWKRKFDSGKCNGSTFGVSDDLVHRCFDVNNVTQEIGVRE